MKLYAVLISTSFLTLSNTLIEGFLPHPFKNIVQKTINSNVHKHNFHHHHQRRQRSYPSSSFALYGGIGTTANYTWKEEQFEIELRIPVPPETRAKHVTYKPKSKSMEVYIELEKGHKQMLLDGRRQFRGLIDLDGTFWSLLDAEESSGRELAISIEKLIMPPDDPFAVVDYDWGSVYVNDDDEILSKTYDEAEELDIREYAASLGVDIDNINMTMVDKSMFSSGLNLTRNTLDELTKSGYAKEVTTQGGGMEFSEEGVAFKPLGDKIGDDEIEDAGISGQGGGQGQPVPFLDTDSPWRKSMPVEEARGVEGVGSAVGQEPESDTAEKIDEADSPQSQSQSQSTKYRDPVDKLTVSKLKDILRKEGLKVSGTKKELQTRLKDHVSSIMQQKKDTTQDSGNSGESGLN